MCRVKISANVFSQLIPFILFYLLNYVVDIRLICCYLLLDPIFRGVSKTTAKFKTEIFGTKVKTCHKDLIVKF